jgi:hypothetical protein
MKKEMVEGQRELEDTAAKIMQLKVCVWTIFSTCNALGWFSDGGREE